MARRDIMTLAVLLSGLLLAGCETADMADKLGDVGEKVVDLIPGSTKKPLPGERKPVFPEGIPGVAQGVPPELVKGNQPPPETQPAPPPVKEAALDAEKPKPKKKAQAKRRPPAQAADSGETGTPARPVQGGGWPAPPAQQPAQWPASPAQQPAQWPAPPAQQAPVGQAAWPAPPSR
jgi:hypothetical protein